MTNDVKANYFLELIKIKTEHFKQTRNIEFKVNIAAWTLIAAAYHVISKAGNNINCYLILGMFVFAGIHIRWMYLIQRSEKRDIESIVRFRTKIEVCTQSKARKDVQTRTWF